MLLIRITCCAHTDCNTCLQALHEIRDSIGGELHKQLDKLL